MSPELEERFVEAVENLVSAVRGLKIQDTWVGEVQGRLGEIAEGLNAIAVSVADIASGHDGTIGEAIFDIASAIKDVGDAVKPTAD